MLAESRWTDALSEQAVPIEEGRAARVREVARSVAVSTGVHAVLLAALLLLSLFVERKPEPVPSEPPLQVDLATPRVAIEPPVLPRRPQPKRREVLPPKQDDTRELRMTPATRAQAERPRETVERRDAGPSTRMSDGRPAGGLAGGPLPKPTPGFPDPSPRTGVASDTSIGGRLESFRRALAPPDRPSPGGRRGGGSGAGGFDLPDLPPTGFGFGNLRFESSDFDWGDYARQIYIAIWRAWHNRLYLTTETFEKWAFSVGSPLLDHQSALRFTIHASGEVTDVALETPSGCKPLDDSAADALRAVVLPRLPADFPREQETVHARFIAEGDIRSMRSTLTYLKSAGRF